MNIEKFSETAYLYALGELSAEEKIEFENIIAEDSALNEEFQKIQADLNLFEKAKPAEISDSELAMIRYNLFREIRKETNKINEESLLEKFKRLFLNNYTLAFGGVATFILGIMIGYSFFFSQNKLQQLSSNNVERNSNYSISQNEQNINPVKEEYSDTKLATKPLVRYKRETSLAAMLVGNFDDGIRIRSVNKISEQVDLPTFKPDIKIKNALIKAMKSDSNPAVRKEALLVLQKYPFDSEIRDALLLVLSKDKNSGLRVAAINALSDLRIQGLLVGDEVKQVLVKKAESENNKYVKYRAALILKEVE